MADPRKSSGNDDPSGNAPDEPALTAQRASNDDQAWDQSVIEELASLRDVRAVFITNCHGGALLRAGQVQIAAELCEQIDLTLAALEHAGRVLGVDALRLHVSTFDGATWVASVAAHCHANVLAEPGANLGQLLSFMRRILPSNRE